MQKNKPLFSDGAKVVYEIPALGEVTDKLVETLEWPKEIPTLGLVLGSGDGDEYQLIQKNISEKYSVRVVYGAKSGALALPQGIAGEQPLQLCSFPDQKTLVEAYVDTQKEYFYKPWAKYVPMALLENAKKFAEKYALPSRARWFKKDGEMVGLVVLVEWKDWFGTPADLLAWLWFSPALSGAERKFAHDMLLTWLRREAAGEITCAVDSFNQRSQRFFRKIGFVPKCLIINRASC